MIKPTAIRNSKSRGELQLEWPDNSVQTLAHGLLRSRCPCSHCRAAKLRGRIDLVDETVRVSDMVDQRYGVQLVFSDGHALGIYPWAFIRDMT